MLRKRLAVLWGRTCKTTLLCVMLAVSALTLRSDEIRAYDSTEGVAGGSDPVQTIGPLYDSFSTVAIGGLLSDLTLAVQGDPTSVGFISVGLFADTGSGTAGTLLANLGVIADSALSVGGGLVAVSLAVNPELEPATRYWIGLSGSDTTAAWYWTSDASGTGVADEFFENAFGSFPNQSIGGYQMAIEITPSPEPPALFLGAFALMAFGLLARTDRCMWRGKALLRYGERLHVP